MVCRRSVVFVSVFLLFMFLMSSVVGASMFDFFTGRLASTFGDKDDSDGFFASFRVSSFRTFFSDFFSKTRGPGVSLVDITYIRVPESYSLDLALDMVDGGVKSVDCEDGFCKVEMNNGVYFLVDLSSLPSRNQNPNTVVWLIDVAGLVLEDQKDSGAVYMGADYFDGHGQEIEDSIMNHVEGTAFDPEVVNEIVIDMIVVDFANLGMKGVDLNNVPVTVEMSVASDSSIVTKSVDPYLGGVTVIGDSTFGGTWVSGEGVSYTPAEFAFDVDSESPVSGDQYTCDENGKIIQKIGDNDIDNDGIANFKDDDMDGDGIPNEQDSETSVPVTGEKGNSGEVYDPETGEVIDDKDIDDDGIPNDQDDDMDGDGIPNDEDSDDDGDGTEDKDDSDPDNPYDSICEWCFSTSGIRSFFDEYGDDIANYLDGYISMEELSFRINVQYPGVMIDDIDATSDMMVDMAYEKLRSDVGQGLTLVEFNDLLQNNLGPRDDLDGDGILNRFDTDLDFDGDGVVDLGLLSQVSSGVDSALNDNPALRRVTVDEVQI